MSSWIVTMSISSRALYVCCDPEISRFPCSVSPQAKCRTVEMSHGDARRNVTFRARATPPSTAFFGGSVARPESTMGVVIELASSHPRPRPSRHTPAYRSMSTWMVSWRSAAWANAVSIMQVLSLSLPVWTGSSLSSAGRAEGKPSTTR